MTLAVNMHNLPKKFFPNLIGHKECTATPEDAREIEALFLNNAYKKQGSQLKPNIVACGKWILKTERTDGLNTTPDTHLYRVRKAIKIQKFLVSRNLHHAFQVPKKYIYWNKSENKFYVVVEKLDLSQEVAKPCNMAMCMAFKSVAHRGGQAQSLAQGCPERELTIEQVKGLAELSFLGYTDLSYNNAFFTKEGKVAIIDTEPQKRALKKSLSRFNRIFFDVGGLLVQQSLAGTAKLKLYCTEEGVREIEKIEKKHVLWSIAKLVTKLAVVIFLFSYRSLIPSGIAFGTLKFAVTSLLVLKSIGLLMVIASVFAMKNFSQKKDVGTIAGMEAQGFL